MGTRTCTCYMYISSELTYLEDNMVSQKLGSRVVTQEIVYNACLEIRTIVCTLYGLYPDDVQCLPFCLPAIKHYSL